MSLVELKQIAKNRRIKMYYTKKRVELIQLLSMAELPDSFALEKLTIKELRDQAKVKGLRGFWSLHRDDLLTLLYPNGHLRNDVQKKPEDSEYTEQSKDPQPHESE